MTEFSVLEAITPSRIGGAEVFTADLCEGLPTLGARVELFCPEGRPFVEYAARRGITSVNWKTRGKFDPLTVFRLARLLRQRNIDVIHTHLSTASLLGAFAARLAGKRSVAHVHGLNTATCFRKSDAVIAVSGAVKSHLSGQGMDERKIHVVHGGVDPAKFQPVRAAEARRNLGYDPDSPIFGVFGRLSNEKGQRTAVEAMSFLLQNNRRARLLIVGDGRDREELAALAASLGIADHVHFTGFQTDIRPFMSACDAVIVPSVKEGFGLAAVEAMAMERPVIASATGGLPEIVIQGETGFLIPCSDPNAVARSMESIIVDGDIAQAMGARGRERAREHFDLSKQIARVLTVLRETAGRVS